MYKINLLEKVATSDCAFEVLANSIEEIFLASAISTTNEMVDRDSIEVTQIKEIKLENKSLEKLLFEWIEEIIFLKDANCFLGKEFEIDIKEREGIFTLNAKINGAEIDTKKQKLNVDVKAVTLHLFLLEKREDNWYSRIVLDI